MLEIYILASNGCVVRKNDAIFIYIEMRGTQFTENIYSDYVVVDKLQ